MRYTSNEIQTKHEVFDITLKGEIDVRGTKIRHIEGGFGKDCKVILARDIAEIHEMELKEVNKLINNNIDEFEEGIDIIDLKNSVITNNPLFEMGFSKQTIANSKNIYILSEQGYMALVSLMRTDKAREIRKQLRREYFAMRGVIKSDEQLKAKLLLDIYNGGQQGVIASRELTKIEVEEATKPLIETIEEQKPKVEYYEDVLQSDGLITTTNIAKDLGISAVSLNRFLNEKGIIYKSSKNYVPYSSYYRWILRFCD